jgi:hypothetical protein
LERVKTDLADSARFATKFASAGTGPIVASSTTKENAKTYKVTLTYTRAPNPLYALRVQALVGWNTVHAVRMAVLVPGPNPLLR